MAVLKVEQSDSNGTRYFPWSLSRPADACACGRDDCAVQRGSSERGVVYFIYQILEVRFVFRRKDSLPERRNGKAADGGDCDQQQERPQAELESAIDPHRFRFGLI